MSAEELAKAFGYMTLAEVACLKNLARGLPPAPLAVNIGAGVGTSGLALLEARWDLRLKTVDPFRGPRPEGGLENERLALEEAGIDVRRYKQIADDSILAARSWDDPIDLLFIDGNHSYEYVKDEILAWLPHVKDGGIIALHDCGQPNDPEDVWPGVRQAVDECLLGAYSLMAYVGTLVAFEKRGER